MYLRMVVVYCRWWWETLFWWRTGTSSRPTCCSSHQGTASPPWRVELPSPPPPPCSEPQGLCYVETSNLDGETNLKIRQAHALTVHCDSVAALSALEVSQAGRLVAVVTLCVCVCVAMQGQVEYEGPNSRLYEFTGNMHIQGEQ